MKAPNSQPRKILKNGEIHVSSVSLRRVSGYAQGEEIACLFSINTYTVNMREIRFEWDEGKNRENKRKHGVSFEEAKSVFLDENALRYFDPDHSLGEDRFLMLGVSFKLRVLVVCHCYQVDDSLIRIISARKANRKESTGYWEYWR